MRWLRLAVLVGVGALAGCGDNNPGGNRGRTDNVSGAGAAGGNAGQPASGGPTPGSKWDDQNTGSGGSTAGGSGQVQK